MLNLFDIESFFLFDLKNPLCEYIFDRIFHGAEADFKKAKELKDKGKEEIILGICRSYYAICKIFSAMLYWLQNQNIGGFLNLDKQKLQLI